MPRPPFLPTLICAIGLSVRSASGDDAAPLDAAVVPGTGEPRAGLAAVSKLLAGTGRGRVADAQVDAVVKRLAQARRDADRRGDAALVAECDADGDGEVSRAEARAAVAAARVAIDSRTGHVDRLFTAVDRDSSRSVDQAEWLAFLESLGPLRPAVEPFAVRFVKAADVDRDGGIGVEEARLRADACARLLLVSGGGQAKVEDPALWLQVVQVVERADADGSLGLSAAEVAGTTVFKSTFSRLDSDGSGEVSAAELHARASDLSRTGGGEICQTCPLSQQAGRKKLDELQCLMTIR